MGLKFNMTWCPCKKRKLGKNTEKTPCEDEGSELGNTAVAREF